MSFDHIIVGGGTAGSILAARLSEDPGRRVLLLEAGADYTDDLPAELRDGSGAVMSGHNWEMEAIINETTVASVKGKLGRAAKVLDLASGGSGAGRKIAERPGEKAGSAHSFPYPLGKVMGGGSAINGALALQVRPEDLEIWAEQGNDWWTWDRVQRSLGWLENGDDGTPGLPIELTRPEEMTRLNGAFYETCLELGYSPVDVRQGAEAGVGTIPHNVERGQRISTARHYLASARQRPNLTIRSRCLVDRLVTEQHNGSVAATGVEVILDGKRHAFSGAHVILAAGAINSPTILMRSGIGRPEDIERAGGRPLVNRSGVGRHLVDHPAVVIWGVPREGSCRLGEPLHQALLQLKSNSSARVCDINLFVLNALPTSMFPPLRDILQSDLGIGISALVATPRSRGWIELVDCDPTHNPRIHLNCASELEDLERIMEGLRTAWTVFQSEPFKSHVERIAMLQQEVVESDTLLENVIRTTVRGTWHPAGTLRMGGEGDPTAVVDQRGRLYGCDKVTVADASIMPEIPSVPPAMTSMLIGERIAAHLLGLDDA